MVNGVPESAFQYCDLAKVIIITKAFSHQNRLHMDHKVP